MKIAVCMFWRRHICVRDEEKDVEILLGWEKYGQKRVFPTQNRDYPVPHPLGQCLACSRLPVNTC